MIEKKKTYKPKSVNVIKLNAFLQRLENKDDKKDNKK